MRALYSGVSGIRSHQTRMDVIGNNIANVNTVGFKSSRVSFTDVLSQTLSPGSKYTNPQQIGLGVNVGSTDMNLEDGSFQMTGRALDLAIQGEGLFVLKDLAGGIFYSRAGNFDWNVDGYLFSPSNGMRVQGWMADANGNIGRTDAGTMTDIRLVRGDISLAAASTACSLKGNLDAAAAVNTTYETALTAYDSLGRPVAITLQFTKTDAGVWEWQWATELDENGDPDWQPGDSDGLTELTFDTKGKLSLGEDEEPIGIISIDLDDADDLKITVDFSAITQAFDSSSTTGGTSTSTVQIDKIDGTRMGVLDSVYVDESGVITGRYTNGTSRVLAQIALANFNNMAGLINQGNSTFVESPASGIAQVGTPNTGGRGGLVPGNLEGSNVDLAGEFTNMIMTQRGFQANTRVVTTADAMLEEVINMRR